MKGSDVIISSEAGIGHISLNRPNALHALTLGMCRDMIVALQNWETDPAITEITIDHSEGRGFCAGGDIRQLYEALKVGDESVLQFFRTEYQLNHLLFTYRKPTTCVMDGIVMGGGAGIAMPCRKRIATAATQFAMPETSIGLIPDVGGSRFLSRLPGRVGEWLALTGARLNGPQCVDLGLADTYVSKVSSAYMQSSIPRGDIDWLFAGDSLEDIIARLRSESSDFAKEQLNLVSKNSPMSCKVALRLLREGRKLDDFADNLRMEFRVVARLLQHSDILEGIRAYIIEKDNAPYWKPSNSNEVSEAEIDAIFAPLPPTEEWTPLDGR